MSKQAVCKNDMRTQCRQMTTKGLADPVEDSKAAAAGLAATMCLICVLCSQTFDAQAYLSGALLSFPAHCVL